MTPLLVETNLKSFEEYISSLGKAAKKNYKYVKKVNKDLEYIEVPYDRNLVKAYMDMWEEQLIRGKKRKWGFGIGYLDELDERNVLRCFVAADNIGYIALHFVEQYGTYVECHPPMYDKQMYSKRYMGKYMWFNLIQTAIEGNIDFLDLGGGDRGTWRELVKSRKEHPITKYKWMYVPEEVKNNPDKEPDLLVEKGVYKRLYEA